ncbi:hypothetical protein ACOMHN_034415 [Nucella lapillus]
MKRAKTEQIRNAVTQYMRRRHYQESEITGSRTLTTDLQEMSVKKRCRVSTGIENSVACSSITGDFNSCDQQFARLRKFVLESSPQQNEELSALLFPVFVHMYCDLLAAENKPSAHKFHERHTEIFHQEEAKDFVRSLRKLDAKADIQASKEISEFRAHKYTVRLSHTSINHLLTHLKAADNMIVLQIINHNINLLGTDTKGKNLDLQPSHSLGQGQGQPSHSSGQGQPNHSLGQGEGQPSHPSGQGQGQPSLPSGQGQGQGQGQASSGDALRENKEAKKEGVKDIKVETPAAEDDKDVAFADSILDVKELTPVERAEVRRLQEVSGKFESLPPPLPSIVFYTVINSSAHQGLCTSTISPNGQLLSGGFEDSSIRLYRLQPVPLPSSPSPTQCSNSTISLAADYVCKDESHRQVQINPGSEDGVMLRAHSGPVYRTQFTPDCSYLLSCSRDCTVRLWDIAKRTNVALYRGHSGAVWDMCYNPVTNHFATSSRDLTVKLWNLDRGFPLRSFVGHEQDVQSVAVHPNGNYVASGSADKTVRLWDIQDGKCLRTLCGHRGSVLALAFSPNGLMLASAGDDRRIHIWHLNSGTLLKELRGHTDTVYCLAFSPCGELLASGGQDCQLRLWDLSSLTTHPRSQPPPSQTEGHASSELMGAFPTKSASVTCLAFPAPHLLHAVGSCQ